MLVGEDADLCFGQRFGILRSMRHRANCERSHQKSLQVLKPGAGDREECSLSITSRRRRFLGSSRRQEALICQETVLNNEPPDVCCYQKVIFKTRSCCSQLYPINNNEGSLRTIFSQRFIVMKVIMTIDGDVLHDASTNKVHDSRAAA